MMAGDMERIREALHFVPAGDRDTWLRMAMAVKSELGDAGRNLWEEWSQQDESFDPKAARDAWKSIRANGKVTAGTLFHEAKAGGWRDNGSHQKPTPEELAERRRIAAKRAESEAAENARERAEAAKKAATIWRAATEARADHPYLSLKHVPPVATLREIDASAAAAILGYASKSNGEPLTGRLLVAPVKVGDALSTLELIDPDGHKSALYGGAKAGGYWAAQSLPEGDGAGLTFQYGEGVATTLSAKEANGHVSIAALSAGNLPAVAKYFRQSYPAGVHVILADLVRATGEPDPHAIEAARSAGGLVAVPQFADGELIDGKKPTDMNDLAALHGLEAVAACIANAAAPAIPSPQPGDGDAPASDSATPEGVGLVVVSLGDFLAREIPVPEMLLDPIITRQSLSMVYAWRGVGKTWFGLGCAYAIASGGKFLSWTAPKSRRVLYLDGEMPAAALQKRLALIVAGSETEAPVDFFKLVTPDLCGGLVPDLATLEGQAEIDAIIANTKAEFIVIDNLSCWIRSGGAENEAEGWRAIQEWLLRHRSMGRAILLVHHAGKGGAQRGTSKREDILDLSLELRRPPAYEPEQGAAFVVEFKKSRHLTGKDAEAFEASLTIDANDKTAWAVTAAKQSTYDRVVELAGLGLTQKDIADELGVNKSSVSRHWNKAVEIGAIKPKARPE